MQEPLMFLPEQVECSYMMATATVLLLGICVFGVQAAVLETEDAVLNRLARSPGHGAECEDSHGPPSLPPPPGIPPFPATVFQTQQWSGLTRSNGGLQQALYSGAAAGLDSGEQPGSQAFSLASTAVGTNSNVDLSAPNQPSNNIDKKKSDNLGQSSGGVDGFGAKTGGYADDEKFNGGKSSYKESHFSYQSRSGKHFGSHRDFGYHADGDRNKFSGYRHGRGSSEGNWPPQGVGFGSASASSSFSFHGNGQNADLGSTRHFGSENSGYGSHNVHDGRLSSESGYSGYGKSGGFSGDQQKQPLQLGSQTSYGSSSESEQGGYGNNPETERHFGSGNSGYGGQNAQYSQSSSGSGYSRHGKTFEYSGNQQKQQLQLGSQSSLGTGSGSEQGGADYGAGLGSAGSSGHGYENGRDSQSSSSSGYSSRGKDVGFSRNEQQQQQIQQGSQSGYQAGFGSEHGGANYGKSTELGSVDNSRLGGQNDRDGQSSSGSGYSSNGKVIGFTANEQQHQTQLGSQSGYDSGSGSENGFASGSSLSSSNQSGGSTAGAYGSYQGNLQTGLGGALKLASQGLQQAQQPQSGCSTCGKSSYALGKAKSNSGSAIAISVAG